MGVIMNELTLWATKIGDEEWQEQLITSVPDTVLGKAKLEQAKAWAIAQGFHNIRVSKFVYGEMPNFTKTLNKSHRRAKQ